MNLTTIVAIAVLALIVSLAVRYIVREKRRGTKCIGCPFAGTCEKHGSVHHTKPDFSKL
ncbi:MAG: FeoB-associated Cys-rich membrane protein [Firmicutes bacterium]|nr:FeoB-associated Cys-rich membrane protein [Bacillota bacterium]